MNPLVSGWEICTQRRYWLLLSCCWAATLVVVPSLCQQPIYKSPEYTIWPDHVNSGGYSARVVSPIEIDATSTSAAKGAVSNRWVLQDDISAYPQMRSTIPLVDALYNMSLGELRKDTRPDGAFNAGANWEGVWTRDVSYSILLSLAAIQPEASKTSLLHKVSHDRIVQDTGTGGSWPVSTDRVTWSLAAWEVYVVTGDKQWLQRSYDIICNTIRDDEKVVIDPTTGLAHGETTFLDWREQTYPRWLEPIDIYDAEALGTNAVYYRTYRILADMAKELNQPSKEWSDKADRLRLAINEHFWMKDKGNYGQYLYGRVWKTLSPRSDALAESLCMLFDIADPSQQDQILSNQAMLPYGIPTVFPDSLNIPAYHNKTVWPFVQSFWNLAAARRENGDALVYGLASTYREAAVFLSNKENLMSDTGIDEGTVLNSDRQLWSVAGDLAMSYRLFFGMDFAADGLHLQPVVPEAFKGDRLLSNFHYRNSVLSIEVRGFGSNIRAIAMDSERGSSFIPADLTGNHSIVIDLDNQPLRSFKLNLAKSTMAPDTPQPRREGNVIFWKAIKGVSQYQAYRNGTTVGPVLAGTSFTISEDKKFVEYQIAAISDAGTVSFLSLPIASGDEPIRVSVASGSAPFITLDSKTTSGLKVDWDVPTAGKYELTFNYANGNGPINTDNKCAVRTLFVDGKEIGPVVLPQRGINAWNNWGWSNDSLLDMAAGKHVFELRMQHEDSNMNGDVNTARIDALRFTPRI